MRVKVSLSYSIFILKSISPPLCQFIMFHSFTFPSFSLFFCSFFYSFLHLFNSLGSKASSLRPLFVCSFGNCSSDAVFFFFVCLPYRSFVCSFICLFVDSFVYSFASSFIRLFVASSFVRLLVHSYVVSFFYLPARLFINLEVKESSKRLRSQA